MSHVIGREPSDDPLLLPEGWYGQGVLGVESR